MCHRLNFVCLFCELFTHANKDNSVHCLNRIWLKENLEVKEVFEEAARLACEVAETKPQTGPFDCCVIV